MCELDNTKKYPDLIELDEEEDNIQYILDKHEYSLLYFTASWCGPCKKIYPTLCNINDKIQNVNIYKIDIDINDKLVSNNKIKSVPHFIFLNKNIMLGEYCGTDANSILKLINDNIKKNNIKKE